MKRAWLAALAACVALPWAAPAAADEDLTGTPYTVVWRGAAVGGAAAATARRIGQAAPTGGMLRLVDLGTRREIARAAFDTRLGGFMFQLPFAGIDGRAARCLALVDLRNQPILLRSPSGADPGYGFRNPAWEAELNRLGELQALRAERAQVDQRTQGSAGEIARLQAETGLPPGADAASCPLPPPPAEPPRPAGALDPAQAASMAGPLCALRWEREHGSRIDLGRLFGDAGLVADWQGRASAQPVADALPDLRVPIATGDLPVVLEAAAKGRTHLEHADGVRLLGRAHSACRDEVGRRAAAERQRWQKAVEDGRLAPERERQQCAQKLARIAQLQAAQGQAPAFLQALDRRIAQLSNAPAPGDPRPLQTQLCPP